MKKVSVSNLLSNSIIFQVIFLFFLPHIADNNYIIWKEISYVLFAILSFFIILISIKFYLDNGNYIFTTTGLIALGFFIITFMSAFNSLYNNASLYDVLRGILPYSWYIYILCIPPILKLENCKKIIKFIAITAILYSIRVYVYYFIFVYGSPGERVTFHLLQSTSIFPLTGIIIYIYYFLIKKKTSSLFAILVCYISIILTETKSMLLSAILGCIVFCLIIFKFSNDKRKIIEKLVLLWGVIVVVSFLFLTTNLGNRWENAVNLNNGTVEIIDEGSIGPRLIEFETAIDSFRESPLFGKGIGYRWEDARLDYGGSVQYMHNIIAYFLMDYGIVGILFLLYVFINMCFLLRESLNLNAERRGLILLIFSEIATAFIYSNFFAVFRSIDFTVICALFWAMLPCIKEKR